MEVVNGWRRFYIFLRNSNIPDKIRRLSCWKKLVVRTLSHTLSVRSAMWSYLLRQLHLLT